MTINIQVLFRPYLMLVNMLQMEGEGDGGEKSLTLMLKLSHKWKKQHADKFVSSNLYMLISILYFEKRLNRKEYE